MGKYKRRGKSAPRFLQLHHRLLKSYAWHSLTPLQRCGYIELAQLFDSTNNGRLAMSTRRLGGLIPCGKNADILRELEDAGFIETVKAGRYTRKSEERLASEYRLTDFRCDVTGEVPSRRYNPKQLWEPGEAKPKRKALTTAERVRRFRKKRRNGCNAERPCERDGSVPMGGADCVTRLKPPKLGSRKTAKNVTPKGEDVTLSVPLSGTHIHLTTGGAELEGTTANVSTRSETSRKGEKQRSKNNSAIFPVSTVTPLKARAPGHATCKHPTIPSLPAGWHWCRFEKCVVTDMGITVPVVEDPMVGTKEQQDAVRFLRRWEWARAESIAA